MTHDPRTGVSTEGSHEHVVHHREPNYGGYALVAVLVVLAVLFAVWLFNNDDTQGTTGNTSPVVETTLPAETTVPAP